MDEEVESDEDFLPDNENIISASEDEVGEFWSLCII